MKKKIILVIILLLFITISLYFFLKNDEIVKINLGDNKLRLHYNVDILKNVVEKSENYTENYNVSNLSTTVDKSGKMKNFSLSVVYFDKDFKYVGDGYYSYNGKVLTYTYSKDKTMIVDKYSKNNTLDYILKNINKIPLKEEIKKSDLSNYVLSYMSDTQLDKGTKVYSNNKETTIDKDGTYFIIRLNDGSSIVSGKQYLYLFDKLEESHSNYMMQYDYYINDNKLKFTSDFGDSWILADLSEKEVEETLNYYNDNKLLPNSYYIDDSMISFFYGEEPTLKIYDGTKWSEHKFDNLFKDTITRVVGFTNKQFGYVAMGTAFTMGTGEEKQIYFTNDYGNTWNKINTPLNNTSNTLLDLCMYDELNGLIMLKDGDNKPLLYSTIDGGNTWNEVKYESNADYIGGIDSIKKENNQYIITLGQDYYGTLKLIYKSKDLINLKFDKEDNQNIHTVG